MLNMELRYFKQEQKEFFISDYPDLDHMWPGHVKMGKPTNADTVACSKCSLIA